MTKALQRIGILTGGGDAPGLNAVLRAVVKAAAGQGLEVLGIEDGFSGLITGNSRRLATRDVSGILPRGGTILGASNRDNPFKYAAERGGRTVIEDVSDQVIARAAEWALDALVVVGGDGSLAIARELWEKGLAVVGVPKTIDNDLSSTDQTFGFDTALMTATEAIDKLHTTAEAHHRVMVVEVMGRNAGWIALQAGLAGGADVILIPEIPFDIEAVGAKIQDRRAHQKPFSIVVVAEGAKPAGGEVVVQRLANDPTNPVRLGGIGNVIGQQVEELTGMETRVTVLGHVQRGGSPTAFDRILATRFGVAAVEAAVRGRFGTMVALRGTRVEVVPLTAAVRALRNVDPDGELVRTARAIGITFGT